MPPVVVTMANQWKEGKQSMHMNLWEGLREHGSTTGDGELSGHIGRCDKLLCELEAMEEDYRILMDSAD